MNMLRRNQKGNQKTLKKMKMETQVYNKHRYIAKPIQYRKSISEGKVYRNLRNEKKLIISEIKMAEEEHIDSSLPTNTPKIRQHVEQFSQ